jgi:carboxymethylenebutenolidase
MIEKELEVRTADGTADAVLYQPDGDGRWPGVIHLPDIMGVRPSHRDMAKRLAEQGYVVLLTNVFYRTGRAPLWDFPLQFGEERTMKRFGELTGPLSPEAMERDASTYVDFLAKQSSVSGAKMGVVGYCITGQMALRTAASRPDRIGAAASFHGGWLYTDAPTSPHTALPKVKGQLYFGHAAEDHSMPKEAIEKFEKALAAWGGKCTSETYQNAHHGWTVPDSAAYNQPEADRAFGKMTELFRATLK